MSPYVPTGRPRGRPRKDASASADTRPKGRQYVPTGRPRGRPRKDPNSPAVSSAAGKALTPAGAEPLAVEKRGRGRPPSIAKQVEQAIKGKRVVAFRYEGKPRIAEIHSYGIMAGRGHEVASGFQTAGFSRKGRLPGWRLFNLERMTEFTVTTRTFSARPGYTPEDQRFRKLIAKIQ